MRFGIAINLMPGGFGCSSKTCNEAVRDDLGL